MIPGMPSRLGRAVAALFLKEPHAHAEKHDVVASLQEPSDLIPLDAQEGAIHAAADMAARECYDACARFMNVLAIKMHIDAICKRRGVNFPLGETDTEIIKRSLDAAWWLRQLRNEFARRFEHTFIRLGQVGKGVDAYITRESALRQAAQNRKNQKLLESVTLRNELGSEYTLAELAALGVGNKTIRRNELMVRIRGFEEIANTLNHCAMFWTITAPSKFHSVGGTNRKYNGATPRDAQAYLCKIWSRMRAAMKRLEIVPYGFRIAEPHSDGCPHWHMLFFVDRAKAQDMTKIIYHYAMQEDGSEAGAQENRVKLVNIECGKGGSAAGYIAKYVSKNIDGAGVGDHKVFENGDTYTVKPDMFGQEEITPSARVTYWSQVWGIRQFQQIGGAPVGVWRELRRMTADVAAEAPYEIQEAFHACQKIHRGFVDKNGTPVAQADWAEYLRAQGGPQTGRGCKIHLAHDLVQVDGKYAAYEAKKPIGVYAVAHAEEIYKSVRYVWTEVVGGAVAGVAVDLPRTGVNNCTRAGNPYLKQLEKLPVKKFSVAAMVVAAKENPNWSREADSHQVEMYQLHRKDGHELRRAAHLRHLQAKYAE